MKNRLSPSTILSILAIFTFGYAFAQDDRVPDLDSGTKETRLDVGSDLSTEGESKINKPIVVVRDTVQSKPAIKKAESKSKDDTSVLSFNFLYYLIERFKLSDIVD